METHELPDDLNPTGDKCYPLFIPDDPQWRQLILGIIHQLSDENYYRDLAFVPNDVAAVCEQWIQRTLIPLVHSMNDETECGVVDTLLVEFKAATKNNTQGLTGGVEASVIFNLGDFEPSPNQSRVVPSTGKITITGFVHLTSGVATQLTVAIRKNGANDIVRQSFFNTSTTQRMTITMSDECDDNDYYELRVLTNQASTIQNTEFACLKWLRWYDAP